MTLEARMIWHLSLFITTMELYKPIIGHLNLFKSCNVSYALPTRNIPMCGPPKTFLTTRMVQVCVGPLGHEMQWS